MSRLIDLDPEFIRWEDRVITQNRVAPGFDGASEESMHRWVAAGRPTVPHTGPVTHLIQVHSLSEAQGIEFDCPKCRVSARSHRIHVAFAGRGVLDHQATRSTDGTPTRWQVVGGTGLDDLTLSPSIDLTHADPNCWHGFITNGVAA